MSETVRAGETVESNDTVGSSDTVQSEAEHARMSFADEFGLLWSAMGAPLAEGRVLGYLMIMREPYISSAELSAVLGASAGSVSMTTRRLADAGLIKRHVIPGDRSHYFTAALDIWGNWLAAERPYLNRQRQVIERGMTALEAAGEDADGDAMRRMRNGRDYMVWLHEYHSRMREAWEQYKSERDDAGRVTGLSDAERGAG